MPMSHDQGVELGEDLLDWNQSQIKQIFLHLLCLFLVSKRRIAISFDCFDCRLKRRSRQEQELGQAFSSQTGQAWRFNLFISFPPNVLSLSVSAIVKQKFEACTEIQTFASTLSVLRWPWLSKALIWRHRICEQKIWLQFSNCVFSQSFERYFCNLCTQRDETNSWVSSNPRLQG